MLLANLIGETGFLLLSTGLVAITVFLTDLLVTIEEGTLLRYTGVTAIAGRLDSPRDLISRFLNSSRCFNRSCSVDRFLILSIQNNFLIS